LRIGKLTEDDYVNDYDNNNDFKTTRVGRRLPNQIVDDIGFILKISPKITYSLITYSLIACGFSALHVAPSGCPKGESRRKVAMIGGNFSMTKSISASVLYTLKLKRTEP